MLIACKCRPISRVINPSDEGGKQCRDDEGLIDDITATTDEGTREIFTADFNYVTTAFCGVNGQCCTNEMIELFSVRTNFCNAVND